MACGVIVLALMNGCSDDSQNPIGPVDPPAGQVDLNAERGGYTATDESAEFSESVLAEMGPAEEIVEDVFSEDATVKDLDNGRLPGGRVYSMVVLWGMLQERAAGDLAPNDQGNASGYDWSGKLSVTHGTVVLRSTVGFEREDHIAHRGDRRALEWVSRTGEDMDGLSVLVYRYPDTGSAREDSLTFTTPLFTRTFALSELENLDEVASVDGNGNKVRFMSLLTDPGAEASDPARGFLRGRWLQPVRTDEAGHFRGVWLSPRGRTTGYVQGIYGWKDDGKPVFYGKVVDRDGRFRALLEGTWTGNPGSGRDAAASSGSFSGEWFGAGRIKLGELRGHFTSPSDRAGHFSGVWCRGCDFAG